MSPKIKNNKRNKEPHIKKVGEISGFKVWIVNGRFVRENLNHNFTNFGQHHRFKFIPKDEFWVDRECNKGETKYYIDHLLVENSLMSKGMSYDEAINRANLIEKRGRSKSITMKNLKEKSHIIDKIHKRLLKKYSKGINVWVVNGEIVRDLFFIDFTEGGHDKTYSFIPENEIWIDDDLPPEEREFVLLHELHERNLMSKGMRYARAHFNSNKIEFYCRNHPSETAKFLGGELKKLIKFIKSKS